MVISLSTLPISQSGTVRLADKSAAAKPIQRFIVLDAPGEDRGREGRKEISAIVGLAKALIAQLAKIYGVALWALHSGKSECKVWNCRISREGRLFSGSGVCSSRSFPKFREITLFFRTRKALHSLK